MGRLPCKAGAAGFFWRIHILILSINTEIGTGFLEKERLMEQLVTSAGAAPLDYTPQIAERTSSPRSSGRSTRPMWQRSSASRKSGGPSCWRTTT